MRPPRSGAGRRLGGSYTRRGRGATHRRLTGGEIAQLSHGLGAGSDLADPDVTGDRRHVHNEFEVPFTAGAGRRLQIARYVARGRPEIQVDVGALDHPHLDVPGHRSNGRLPVRDGADLDVTRRGAAHDIAGDVPEREVARGAVEPSVPSYVAAVDVAARGLRDQMALNVGEP